MEKYKDEIARLKREKMVDEMLSKASKHLTPRQIEIARKKAMSLSDEEFEKFLQQAEDIANAIVLENGF